MSYSVQHIRYTLECDCCGLVKKHDLDVDDNEELKSWKTVMMPMRHFFCCPKCLDDVSAILEKRDREQVAAKEALIANCVHDIHPRGLLRACTKCGKWM